MGRSGGRDRDGALGDSRSCRAPPPATGATRCAGSPAVPWGQCTERLCAAWECEKRCKSHLREDLRSQAEEQRDRKSDDVEVVTLDSPDQHGAALLDRVGAGTTAP